MSVREPPRRPEPETPYAQWVREYRLEPAPAPGPGLANPSPGPILRANVGDLVQLTFLNQIDQGKFRFAHIYRGDNSIQKQLRSPLGQPGLNIKEGDYLLKVDGQKLPALPLATYSQVRQGETVFAFGSPIGLRNSLTHGLVSAVARQIDPDSPLIFVQTDAPINPGNYGGPLVNIRGEVVGVNTFILSQSGGNEGLGFAIPSATVRTVYRQLRQYGQLRRQVDAPRDRQAQLRRRAEERAGSVGRRRHQEQDATRFRHGSPPTGALNGHQQGQVCPSRSADASARNMAGPWRTHSPWLRAPGAGRPGRPGV